MEIEVVAGDAFAPPDDERALVARACSDPEAFATLYRRYYRMVARYVFRRTGDGHATEDLVADVFHTALCRIRWFRWRGVSMRFWLYGIATRRVGHWARGRRREERRMAMHATSSAGEANRAYGESRNGANGNTASGDWDRVQRALLRLSPRHQAVVALHYLEGLSVDETAAALGCRAGTVKSRLSRARDALRSLLGDQVKH